MIKKITALALVSALALCAPTAALALEGDAEGVFTDVAPEDWYYEAVEFVYQQGIMDGVDGGGFNPEGYATRAQVAAILWRVSGSLESGHSISFEDVPDWAWYAGAVRWALERDIVNGVDGGRFAPDGSVTREQLAVMFHRYAGSPVPEGGMLEGFEDSGSVSSWASEAVEWALELGLINGADGNRIDPQGRATRAQVAAILMRFIGGAVG